MFAPISQEDSHIWLICLRPWVQWPVPQKEHKTKANYLCHYHIVLCLSVCFWPHITWSTVFSLWRSECPLEELLLAQNQRWKEKLCPPPSPTRTGPSHFPRDTLIQPQVQINTAFYYLITSCLVLCIIAHCVCVWEASKSIEHHKRQAISLNWNLGMFLLIMKQDFVQGVLVSLLKWCCKTINL